MRKRIGLFLKIFGSLFLLAILLRRIDWSLLSDTLKQISLYYLLILMFISFLMIAISCWKWQILLSVQKISVPFSRLFSIYLIGYFFTNFLPTNIGGDVVRAYQVGKDTEEQMKSFISVFFERFTGLVVLLSWVIITPLIKGELIKDKPILVVILASGGIFLFILLLLFKRKAFLSLLGKLFPLRILKDKMDKFVNNLKALQISKKILIKVTVITILFYVLTIFNVYFAFLVFRLNIPISEVAALTPIVMVVSMLPISISGLGLTEGAYVYCFSLAGIATAQTFSVALIMRAKLIFLGILGGITYLFFAHKK